jgi:hypothetical protein
VILALKLKLENAKLALNFFLIAVGAHPTHHAQFVTLDSQSILEGAKHAKLTWFIAVNARVKQHALLVLIHTMLVSTGNAPPASHLSFTSQSFVLTTRTVFLHTKPQATWLHVRFATCPNISSWMRPKNVCAKKDFTL